MRGYRIFPPQLRKTAETRHVAGDPLHGGLERTLDETLKVQPGLCYRPQGAGNVTAW